MEFDSPEEKEFPGLYAVDLVDGKGKKIKDDSDYSEDDKVNKKKDKKDKGKDRGYAALEGEESSPEEDAKSPSKSKRSRAFIFTSSKSKEKREKSHDKEKTIERDAIEPDLKLKEKDTQKIKEKDQYEKDREKKKDKEKKEKLKRDKTKDKEKKDRKSKHGNSSSNDIEDEQLALNQPIFGVSISEATERSRCHDGVEIPLLIRDCIDYLQMNSLRDERIYKLDPCDQDVEHFKRLYNNRQRISECNKLDTPMACCLLKIFFKELPEPLLTRELLRDFEDLALQTKAEKQKNLLKKLISQLPIPNRVVLSWLMVHFSCVIAEEPYNRLNIKTLPMLLAKLLQMTSRLMITLLYHCRDLFPDTKLTKYIPPLTSSSPSLPEKPDEIQIELAKQESLLAQLHNEMNAGFVSKRREEQLWEVQRIITQLKRKLKSFEKMSEKNRRGSEDPNMLSSTHTSTASSETKYLTTGAVDEENEMDVRTLSGSSVSVDLQNTLDFEVRDICVPPDKENSKLPAATHPTQETFDPDEIKSVGFYIDTSTGLLMVPRTDPNWADLLRYQLEHFELLELKKSLQNRISNERTEILKLKQLYQQKLLSIGNAAATLFEDGRSDDAATEGDYEKIIEHYERENQLLAHKKDILAKEIFEGRRECIALQVELGLHEI